MFSARRASSPCTGLSKLTAGQAESGKEWPELLALAERRNCHVATSTMKKKTVQLAVPAREITSPSLQTIAGVCQPPSRIPITVSRLYGVSAERRSGLGNCAQLPEAAARAVS